MLGMHATDYAIDVAILQALRMHTHGTNQDSV